MGWRDQRLLATRSANPKRPSTGSSPFLDAYHDKSLSQPGPGEEVDHSQPFGQAQVSEGRGLKGDGVWCGGPHGRLALIPWGTIHWFGRGHTGFSWESLIQISKLPKGGKQVGLDPKEPEPFSRKAVCGCHHSTRPCNKNSSSHGAMQAQHLHSANCLHCYTPSEPHAHNKLLPWHSEVPGGFLSSKSLCDRAEDSTTSILLTPRTTQQGVPSNSHGSAY